MIPCIECGMTDGHWYWCKQDPINTWPGVYYTRLMTREELEREYPSPAAHSPREEK